MSTKAVPPVVVEQTVMMVGKATPKSQSVKLQCQAITNPLKTIFSIKRFMGETYDRVQKEAERVSYKVVRGDNNTPRVDIDGRLYSPQEISAMVLQKMKKTAEDYLVSLQSLLCSC